MKREMFRKLMAVSLATCMVAGLAGCGNGDEQGNQSSSSDPVQQSSVEPSNSEPAQPDSSEPEPVVSKYTVLTDENGNVYDLGGAEITLYTWFGEGEAVDAYGEARDEWREWIQETYNFTFTVDSNHGWGGTSEDFTNYVSTGGDDNNYIFAMANRSDLNEMMKQGLMYPVSDLGCMDFSDAKYANNVYDLFSRGGKVYAFAAGLPEPRGGIYFNKRLLEETTGMTADDLYDLQKNNQWNWAAFEDVMKKIQAGGDIDGDGITDIYGVSGNTGSWVTNIVFSNGGRWFDRDDSGKIVCKAQDPKTVEGFEFAKRIMDSDYWYKNPYTGDEAGEHWDYFFAAFKDEGKIVFLPEDAYNMTGENRFANGQHEDDYGFLMTPFGNSATGYTNKYSDNVYAIPACYDAEKAWKIAFAYDLWFDTIAGFEDYNPHKSGYYQGASDTREVDETIDRMSKEGGCVDLTSIVSGVDIGADLQWFPADQDVSALIEATITKWQTAADEANQ